MSEVIIYKFIYFSNSLILLSILDNLLCCANFSPEEVALSTPVKQKYEEIAALLANNNKKKTDPKVKAEKDRAQKRDVNFFLQKFCDLSKIFFLFKLFYSF